MCRSDGYSRVCVFPAGFASNFWIMVGSVSGPGSTFMAFLGSARVRVPLSNKIRVRVGSVQHIYGSLRVRVRIFGPVKTSSIQSDRHCVDSGAGEDKMSLIKRLKCLVVGCNNEYSSRHLLPTSEPQRINVTFALKWMRRSPIYINVNVRLNHLWSSFIYRSSEYKGFYESLQIAFPNRPFFC